MIRPLEAPEADQQSSLLGADVDSIRDDVSQRVENEGQGARGVSRQATCWKPCKS